MNLKRKLVFGSFALFAFTLVACHPYTDEDSVLIRTREVQTQLNSAGFRVTKIDQSQPNVCTLEEKHEGAFEEYSFVVFAPFNDQEVVRSLTEEAMKDLGIDATEPDASFYFGIVGTRDAEQYYLTFVDSESAIFVATTPCHSG